MIWLFSILNPFEEEDDEKKRIETFESYHTLTIYYLSQVYSAKNMNDKSAKYSAMTLDRELRHTSFDHYVNIYINIYNYINNNFFFFE